MSFAQSRFEEAKAFHICDMLGRCPAALDEALAAHYSSLAATGMSLRKLCDVRRQSMSDADRTNINGCIHYLKAQLRRAHIDAFGLPPNWPE